MTIQTLTLQNFQGIRNTKLLFGGEDAAIFGANGTGKTTIYNAFMWLLTGKNGQNTANFSPKPKDKTGEDTHNLETAVTAELETETAPVTLKKIYREKWVRRNGESTTEMTGHTTDYFVDGEPMKEKEFCEFVDSLIAPDRLRILANPLTFSEMFPWQERRKILFEMCGEVTDADVFAAHPGLAELPDILGGKSVEKFAIIAKKQEKEINEELKTLPTRIDEAEKSIPDVAGLSEKMLRDGITQLEAEKAALAAQTTEDDDALQIRKQISALELALSEERNRHINAQNAQNKSIYDQIGKIDREIADLQYEITENDNKSTSEMAKSLRMSTQRAALEEQYKTAKAETWQGDTTCPTCRRPLEVSAVEDAKAAFESDKKSRMKSICDTVRETCSKDAQADAEQTAKALHETLIAQKRRMTDMQAQRQNLQQTIDNTPFDDTARKAQINALYTQLQTSPQAAAKTITATQTAKINAEIAEKHSLLARFAVKTSQEQRIAKLEERERELAKLYEQLQKGLALCEDFIRRKSEMIEGGICAKFRHVQFALFRDQINGGLKEICDVLVPAESGALVPFAFANHAARINAGLEIIDVLSAHWGVTLPIFVDNRESVTDLASTAAQVISLIVSASDPKIRLECTEKQGGIPHAA